MGPISGGSTKKRVRKYGAMARVSITFIVALRSEVKQLKISFHVTFMKAHFSGAPARRRQYSMVK